MQNEIKPNTEFRALNACLPLDIQQFHVRFLDLSALFITYLFKTLPCITQKRLFLTSLMCLDEGFSGFSTCLI